MSLIAQIKKAQIEARKAHERERAQLLTTLIGEAEMVGKNAGREVTDAEVSAVIKKFLKNMTETIAILGEDHPQSEAVRFEMNVLEGYMPKQLSEEQLASEIQGIHAGLLGAGDKADMGAIMKFLKLRFEGLYDGKLAATLIKKELS